MPSDLSLKFTIPEQLRWDPVVMSTIILFSYFLYLGSSRALKKLKYNILSTSVGNK